MKRRCRRGSPINQINSAASAISQVGKQSHLPQLPLKTSSVVCFYPISGSLFNQNFSHKDGTFETISKNVASSESLEKRLFLK